MSNSTSEPPLAHQTKMRADFDLRIGNSVRLSGHQTAAGIVTVGVMTIGVLSAAAALVRAAPR